MFDLEKQVAVWRKQLTAAGIKTKSSLNELENHLREQIAQQAKSGASEERAWELAIEKMGPVNSLAREFKKVAASKHVQRRKRMSIVNTAFLGFYVAVITARLCAEDLANQQRWLCIAALMMMLVLHFCAWRFVPRFAPVIRNRMAQSTIGIIGGSLGAGWFIIFVRVILPRCNFMPGELLAAILWAMIPLMLFPAVSFLITDKSEYHELTADT